MKENERKIKVNKNYEIKLLPNYFNVGDELIFEGTNNDTIRIKKKD